jgi:hypothetical protein
LKALFWCGFSRCGTSRNKARRTTAAVCRPEGLLHLLTDDRLLETHPPSLRVRRLNPNSYDKIVHIFTDPPVDVAHPAKMTVLHIPSRGVLINGIAYQPAGAGLHPTLVICHGLPGNEKNLDLAQAVRCAGWNAITFNYRGSWGSPGVYRFTQNLEEADAVLAYLRDPANATRLGIDT